jgi:hypothetical protein
MPVRKQMVTDGITSARQIVINPPRSRSELRADKKALRVIVEEDIRRRTFDGRVADLERLCRRTPGVRTDHRPPSTVFGSRAWYAEEILSAVEDVRDALKRDDPQLATSEAVVVGALAAEAEAKFRWGDVLLRDARVKQNREFSQRSTTARRATVEDRDHAIIAAARTYRKKYRMDSTRAMARSIAGPLDMKFGTVRDRLRKRGVR